MIRARCWHCGELHLRFWMSTDFCFWDERICNACAKAIRTVMILTGLPDVSGKLHQVGVFPLSGGDSAEAQEGVVSDSSKDSKHSKEVN